MVSIAISQFDREVLSPRQERQHEQNTSRLKELEAKVEDMEILLTEAKGSWRIIKWLLIYISGAISVLLTDFIVWFARNGWHI